MKTIGLIGGLAWPSTITYYRTINTLATTTLGGLHSAPLVLVQTDFHELETLRAANNWTAIHDIFWKHIDRLHHAGADFFIVACNTYHMVAEKMAAQAPIPLFHLVDALGARITQDGYRRVGLLGTMATMTGEYMMRPLRERYGVGVVVPGEEERLGLNRTVVEELARGLVLPESRDMFRGVIGRLVENGAEAIILGCTELGLLVRQEDSPVPLIDTALVHAEAAAEMALGEG